MGWWGKVIGGAFGFMLGGPLGALLGAVLGHQLDAAADTAQPFGVGARERTQTAFFTAVFSVMGHLAKADGRVSEEEIEMAESVMAQMDLRPELRRAAIRLFTEGKRADFPLDEVVDQFRRECRRRHTLMQLFLEIQLHAAYADGVLHPEERRVLLRVCDRLGVPRAAFAHLEAMVRAERHRAHRAAAGREAMALRDAYAILDVRPDAPVDEIKRAYRRLMNRHHPDKLVAKGLPEEMMRLATEKTQEIKAAYERIRQARGF